MCRYRYQYFPCCRHQRTVLLEFCDHAHELHYEGKQEDDDDGSLTTLALATYPHQNALTAGTAPDTKAAAAEGTIPADNDDHPSVCPTLATCSTPISASEPDSAFIIAEPSIDTTSLPSPEHPPRHSSFSAPLDISDLQHMASFPLFDIRQWISGGCATALGSGTTGHSDDVDRDGGDLPDGLHREHIVRVRQPGIREHTDESYDLPRSDDILQYLAESYSSQHATGSRSPIHDVCRGDSTKRIESSDQETLNTAREAYDAIEAEIDSLKDDVLRLRQQADRDRTAPKTDQELAQETYLSTRSKRTTAWTNTRDGESPADRLLRLHEAQQKQPAQRLQSTAVPPSAQDFPCLGRTKSSTGSGPAGMAPRGRKSSYAEVATNGMMEAIGKALYTSKITAAVSSESTSHKSAGNLQGRSNSTCRPRALASDTFDHHQKKDDNESAIVLSDINAPSTERASLADSPRTPPSNSTTKHMPHFAQPTKSFARRAGETVRRESASLSPRSPAEGSPTKTPRTKEPILSTATRAAQHQQKRKSLPVGWMDASAQALRASPTKTSLAGCGVEHLPKSTTAPPLTGEAKGVDGSSSKGDAARLKLKEGNPSSIPRMAKKSYMAPTVAAAQRSVVPIARVTAQVALPACNPVEPNADSAKPAENLRVSTTTMTDSEASSVCFILDQGTGASSGLAVDGLGIDHHSLTERLRSSPTQTSEHPPQPQSRHNLHASYQLAALPAVQNTTTTRRTSYGHLLVPIFASLNAKGLLSKNPTNAGNVFRSQGTQNDNVEGSSGNAIIASAYSTQTPPDTSLPGQMAPPTMFVPPHLRKRRTASSASTSTSVASLQLPTPVVTHAQVAGQSRLASNGTQQSSTLRISVPALDTLATPTAAMTSRTSSLRATAKAFEPPQQFVRTGGELDYVPVKKWQTVSPRVRTAVYENRVKATSRPWQKDPVCDQQIPYDVFEMPTSELFPSPVVQDDWNATPSTTYATPVNVQAGQVIFSSLSPGKKHLQWMLRQLDGTETPMTFGRAPPPMTCNTQTPPTPTPLFDGPSQKKPRSSSRGWHIGSTHARTPFGWKGGDGKEISFRGYGPYAERDPHNAVNFDYNGATSKFITPVPNGFIQARENEYPEVGIAPRSQRQWAEKLGYTKVPCGNVDISEAIEWIQAVPSISGYCYDCAKN